MTKRFSVKAPRFSAGCLALTLRRVSAAAQNKAQRQMNCLHCLEPMNEGATICKACGRRQRRSLGDLDSFSWFLIAMGAFICVLIGLAIFNTMSKSADITSIMECEHANGDLIASRSSVRQEIQNQAMGRSWKDGVTAVRILHLCLVNVN